VLVSTAAATASGCSTIDDAPHVVPSASGATQEYESTIPAQDRARSGVPIEAETPFAPYLPYLELPASATEEYDLWQGEVFDLGEGERAKCMKAEGFDYQPRVWETWNPEQFSPLGTFAEGDVLWLPWLPETREEVEARGYGKGSPDSIGLPESGADSATTWAPADSMARQM
jgi:uncharacterized protein YceK